MTRAPRAASSSATALPMPCAPLITTASLLFRSCTDWSFVRVLERFERLADGIDRHALRPIQAGGADSLVHEVGDLAQGAVVGQAEAFRTGRQLIAHFQFAQKLHLLDR